MKNILRTAAAVAALTLASTPAYAVPATQNATATARIVKPLTLTSIQNFDLGTVTLVGSGATTVSYSRAGVFSCPAGNVTCAGPRQLAVYKVTGVNNQTVSVTTGDVVMENQANTALTLTLDVDAPATVLIDNSSPTNGTDFAIGGAITVDGSTAEGTYIGDFEVTVNY